MCTTEIDMSLEGTLVAGDASCVKLCEGEQTAASHDLLVSNVALGHAVL